MSLKQTPLHDRQVELGGRMVEFGGWQMPVQYTGIVAEHTACRTAAALFDVSHMGEFTVTGPEAGAWLERMLTNRVSDLELGRCRYTLMCAEDGGILEDLLVYRTGDEAFLLVVNAANIDADLAWLESHREGELELTDVSDERALLALQGPRAKELLQPLVDDGARLAELKYYRFGTFELDGVEALVSRTGYTGEFGYEIMIAPERAVAVWDRLLTAGEPLGLLPAGLGARDTLRLEAGLCLHGHDISAARNPIEAGLDRFVDLAGDYLGADAIRRAAESGTAERLVGLRVGGRGIIRDHCAIEQHGTPVGEVTSGTFSPTLATSIGLGYVARDAAEVGGELAVIVRGKPLPVSVVETPFYRRG